SATAAQNVTVRVSNIPSWLGFTAKEWTIKEIAPGGKDLALFTFSAHNSAPVGRNHTLTFTISTPSGQMWIKEVTFAVAAPERFELLQNYPNPFNPSTTIAYQLPAKSRVILKVFNVLGQEVATVFDGQMEAGYHQDTWSASAASSGVYIAQVVALDDRGNRWVARRTMLYLK
ncbi:MAG: T9SS type A sorting domain-containing protein, partial [Bacteroidota bacterium]